MKYIAIFLVFLYLNTSSYSNEWEEVFQLDGIPQGLETPDTNNCYIFTTLGIENRVYRSNDQGKNWKLLYEDFFDEFEIQFGDMISVPDTSNIFCATTSKMFKSSNGGVSFEKVDLGDIIYFRELKMRTSEVGAMTNIDIRITKDGWETYKIFDFDKDSAYFSYYYPRFVNDSILYALACDVTTGNYLIYLLKLNINTFEYELNFIINSDAIFRDLCVVNQKIIFAAGKFRATNGGSGNDVIYKSTDAGRTWRCVLDIRPTSNNLPEIDPFGIQSIDFKDSLTGIAVGSGKILYTYDSGESWTYEDKLPKTIEEKGPPTMIIRYVGSEPVITSYIGHTFTYAEDDLSPGPEDIYSISGRVLNGDEGLPEIPITNGYQITMTDSLGYYKFNDLSKGTYTIKAVNKYYDDDNPDLQYDYFEPYIFQPKQHVIELTSDTTGFDFNSEDTREYHSITGRLYDLDNNPIPNLKVYAADVDNNITHTAYTDENGIFKFEDLIESWVYIVYPKDEGWTFKYPTTKVFLRSDEDSVDFLGYRVGGDPGYYKVAGYLHDNILDEPMAWMEVTLGERKTTTRGWEGIYYFEHVKEGIYLVKLPDDWNSKMKFVPGMQEIVVDRNIDSVNFVVKWKQQDTAYISGNVYNADTTAAANIALKLGEYESTSNQNGVYIFDNIPHGKYRLEPVSELAAGLAYNPPYYDMDLYSDKDTVRFFIEPVNSVEEQEHEGININTSIDNDNISISISSEISSNNLNISVFTVQGVKLLSSKFELAKGENCYQIPVEKLKTGLYVVNITAGDLLLGTEKVIIVK